MLRMHLGGVFMSLKSVKATKLKESEMNKIQLYVDCLKEKMKANEPITEADKAELLSDIGNSLDIIMSYQD